MPFFLLLVLAGIVAWVVVPNKPVSFFSNRMYPNLTKGFGMIGPKDFFPLLDFAYMPNNSLTPR